MGDLVPLRRLQGELESLSDEALLAACATGDRAALGGLFDRFHVPVYRFVARIPSIDAHSRDDVVQATFLALPAASGQFQARASVKTWILGIAANVARHQLRAEVRRNVRHHTFASQPVHEPDTLDAALDRRQLMTRIATELAALPHDQQVAFAMCDLEEIPGTEAARALGVPEGTLWRRLHMARKALRAALARSAP